MKCNSKQSKNRSLKRVQFIVDDEHKVAYCGTAKIASSTWRMILMMSTKQGKLLERPRAAHDPKNLKARGLRMTSNVDSNYTKFMIVRHPLDRYVSGYRDKMAKKYNKLVGSDRHWIHIRHIVLNFNNVTVRNKIPIVDFRNFSCVWVLSLFVR